MDSTKSNEILFGVGDIWMIFIRLSVGNLTKKKKLNEYWGKIYISGLFSTHSLTSSCWIWLLSEILVCIIFICFKWKVFDIISGLFWVQNLGLWRCSKPSWHSPGQPVLGSLVGGWTRWPQRSLSTSNILWVCDSSFWSLLVYITACFSASFVL